MKVKLFIIKFNEPTHPLFSPFFPEEKKVSYLGYLLERELHLAMWNYCCARQH